MDRRSFLGRVGALGWAAHAAAGPQGPRPPSILLVLADAWRGQALEAAGDPNLRAPNLDELIRTGVLFPRAYTPNPACAPARAALLTGRYPHACRVLADGRPLPADERTVSEALAEAGYATGFIGKWALDGADEPGFVPPGPRRRGFAFWAAFNRGHRYFDPVYFRDSPQAQRGEGFEPEYQTRLACDFIREHAMRPFFLVLAWGPPHPPRTPPAAYAQLYDPARLRLRANVPGGAAAEARQALAGYYGLCSALDACLGRLLTVLKQTGTAEDTVVVFTSDHGEMLGSHGLDLAEAPFEEAVRIPLLIRYPRAGRVGRRAETFVSSVDLAPTLLVLAGLEPLEGMQGRDLSAHLVSGEGSRAESVYVQGRLATPAEWRMLVRGLDKVVVDRELRVTNLYNLGQDPYERRNLAFEPGQARRRDEMTAILRDRMRRLGDRVLPSGLKIRQS